MIASEQLRRPAAAALRILVVAGAYWLGGRIGFTERVVVDGAIVTPLWPPTGIALTALLWLGLSAWPGILIGAVATIATINTVSTDSLGILAGNTLAPVTAYLMLRAVNFRPALDRLRDGVLLVFLGALGGMLISATAGAGTLLANGALAGQDFWPIWAAWWAGDAMGVLVVTPLLLVLRSAGRPVAGRDFWWTEAVALAVVTVGVAWFATRTESALLFLVFPVLIWAALRYQLAGSAPCTLLVSVFAVTAATSGQGPFEGRSMLEAMALLQALNGAAALTGLLLGALVTEQLAVRRRIEEACVALADVVDQLAPGETAHLWPLPGGPRTQGRGDGGPG
ncbi:MASE1 domain-containing protein [Streptomyces genisteinicus]|uniref:MASE1 domain-containing protein n=1 Tax=Streptomyces genisteinicus TaxID=2768068 RepID=A0A7H0HMP7_9ACTN|nr:MASE1 domain-containing protein [Streptomyces genisteinicus]QNP61813.1 MASE1 domain-containing protein [Streptomyces genisteinicus]